MRNKIYLGWDNGNGTSVGSAESQGDICEFHFPSSYAIGDPGFNYLGDDEELRSAINPDFNGNTKDLFVRVGQETIWGGQSSFSVSGNPINPIGYDRYDLDDYMEYMYLLSIRSLLNGNLNAEKENDLYITVGVPPKVFYKEPDRLEKIKKTFRRILRVGSDKHVELDGKHFFVADLTFTAEGAGGYYDHCINDDILPSDNINTSEGVLIIDAGRYTLDTFILVDDELGEEDILSEVRYGIDGLMKMVAERINAKMPVTVTDIERRHYTGNSRITQLRDDKSYQKQKKSALRQYLNEVKQHLTIYSRYVDRFSSILVMGGVLTFLEGDDKRLKKFFGLGGNPVYGLSVWSNARGYRKIAKMVSLSEED